MDAQVLPGEQWSMGLEPGYPAVTMNDPDGHVTVFDERHRAIGRLGPTPFESPSVNVTCLVRAWCCRDWYRLLNPAGFSTTALRAYVSADETHPLPASLPVPRCRGWRCCWLGLRWPWCLLLPVVAVVVVAFALTRRTAGPDGTADETYGAAEDEAPAEPTEQPDD